MIFKIFAFCSLVLGIMSFSIAPLYIFFIAAGTMASFITLLSIGEIIHLFIDIERIPAREIKSPQHCAVYYCPKKNRLKAAERIYYMKMIRVVSNKINAIGYDPIALTLRVQFHSGETCEYHNVQHHIGEDISTMPNFDDYFTNIVQRLFESHPVNIS